MKKHILIAFLMILLCNIFIANATTKSNEEAISSKILNESDTVEINWNFDQYLETRQSNPMKALSHLQRAMDVAQLLSRFDKVALINYHKGYLYRMTGVSNLALQCYTKALKYYEKSENSELLGWLLIDIGNLYYANKTNLDFAIEHYNKAKNIFTQLENGEGKTVSEYCIGLTYTQKKQYDTAIKHFSNAVAIARPLKEKAHFPVALVFMGEAYLKKGDFKAAEAYLVQSLEISKKDNYNQGIANAYSQLAVLADTLGDVNKCISIYKEALSYLMVIPDKAGISDLYENISKVYRKQNDLSSAISYAEKSLAVADSFNIQSKQQEVLPLLAGYYASTNQQGKAYSNLQRYMSMKESGNSFSARQTQQEYESQLRAQEAAQMEYKHKKQQVIALIAIVAFMVVMLLLVLIFNKNKDLKLSYKNLFDKHLALTQKEAELVEIKKTVKNRFPIKEELHQELVDQLTQLMETDKLYLNKDITLDDLAKKLGTNRTYLSQFINDRFQTNFNNYINEFRIKEAQKVFMEPASKLLTIEAIAQNVGFNSKSSFNIAFKKFTGLTPSDFLALRSES